MVNKYETRTLLQYKKQEILDRDVVCVYCGEIATEVDHVVPWSYTHCNDYDNLVGSCKLCNKLASNIVFPNFDIKREYIRKKRGTRKYLSRIDRDVAICNSCGICFHPGINGAKRFTCADCDKQEYGIIRDRGVEFYIASSGDEI